MRRQFFGLNLWIMLVLVALWTPRVLGYEAKFAFPASDIPNFNIPKMAAPPTIDGRIEEKEWSQSVRLMGVTDNAGNLNFADMPTAFYVGWDEQHLYIAARTLVPENKTLTKRFRERYAAGVVHDDSFEFGIGLMGRNRSPGEHESFYKMVLNSYGSGEFQKIYPSIGQSMFTWRPNLALKNGLHVTPQGRFWELELAMDLKDLELPRNMQAGDLIRLLTASELKLPGVGYCWNALPSASMFLVDTGYPVGTLTVDRPFARIEQLTGLHHHRFQLRAIITNPGATSAKVKAHALVLNRGKFDVKSKESDPDKTILDTTRELEIPAGGQVELVIDEPLTGIEYTRDPGFDTQDKARHGRFQLLITDLAAPAGANPVYRYVTLFKNAIKPNRFTSAVPPQEPVAFPLELTFNPVRSTLYLAGDTLEVDFPTNTKPAALDYAVLDSQGKSVTSGRITQFVHRKYEDLVQMPALNPGVYAVSARMVDASGNTLLERTGLKFEKKDEAKEFAAWWGNSIGRIDRVLKPFEPITVAADASKKLTSIKVTRREYQLDGLGLPAQIHANGGPVLKHPARLIVTIEGKEHIAQPDGALTITSAKDWRVEFTGAGKAGPFTFQTRGSIEQDGLTDLHITYTPGASTQMQHLRVEFPIDDVNENWMAAMGSGGNYAARTIGKVPEGQGVVWDTMTSLGTAGTGMTVGNWLGNLWIGNDQRGLLWCGDSDRGWLPRDDRPAHTLSREPGVVILSNHVISQDDSPVTLDKPATFQVMFNASPFRDMPRGWRLNQASAANGFYRKPKYKIDWDTGKEWFSLLSPPFTDTARWPEYYAHCKAEAEKLSRDGWQVIRPRLRDYITNQIALRGYQEKTREPGLYHYFRADWMSESDESLNASYLDHMIYLMDRQVREGGAAHFYFDISFTRVYKEPSAGFGYRLPDGRLQSTSGDANLRQWYQRVWAMMQDNGLYPGGVSGHATNDFSLRMMPWTDALLDSEFPMVDPIYTYPMDRMIALSVPHNFGTRMDHLGFMNPDWAIMHDSGMGDYGGRFLEPEFRQFGIARDDVKFTGYWRNKSVIKQITPGVLASLWSRPNAALIAVLNHGVGNQSKGDDITRPVDLTLDLKALGVPAKLAPEQLRLRELPVNMNIITKRYNDGFEWYAKLPDAKHPRGHNEIVKLRPPANATIDPATGRIAGGEIFFHDVRYLLVTWDDELVQDSTWRDLFVGPARQQVLDWGIGRADTQPMDDAAIQKLLGFAVNSGLQVQAWRQSESVLVRLTNLQDKPQIVTAKPDLKTLGLMPAKLWERFLLAYGILGDEGDLDVPAGQWTFKLAPREVRIVTLTLN